MKNPQKNNSDPTHTPDESVTPFKFTRKHNFNSRKHNFNSRKHNFNTFNKLQAFITANCCFCSPFLRKRALLLALDTLEPATGTLIQGR